MQSGDINREKCLGWRECQSYLGDFGSVLRAALNVHHLFLDLDQALHDELLQQTRVGRALSDGGELGAALFLQTLCVCACVWQQEA